MLDLIDAGYFLLDPTGVIRDINQSGRRMLGAEHLTVIGVPLRNWLTPSDRRLFLEHLRQCRSGDFVIETEVGLRPIDGGRLPVRLYTRQSQSGGHAMFPTVAIDRTEYLRYQYAQEAAEVARDAANRERELAQAAEAAKDRLIAIVSHELRNPLSPALVAAQGLAEWPALPERARHLAGVIRRNIELEARLIDDLLDVARIARGQLRLHLEITDVHELLSEAIAAVQAAANEKDLTVTFDPQAADFRVSADPTRLRQVFWNLLHNAVKFSERQGTVLVRTRSSRGKVSVIVRDHGVGMDSATADSAFESFVIGAPGRFGSGLGLGLSIAREIVLAHGGRIFASSPGLGWGSVFEVELAAVSAPAKEVPRKPAPPRRHVAARPLIGRGRVLIVEDDADGASVMALFLKERGYEPMVATSFSEGIALVERDWQAIISDIGLGDGSGLDLARAARAGATPPGRLIALSGYGSRQDLQASREAGFDAHLVKPVDFQSLLNALSSSHSFGARAGRRHAG